MTAVEQPPAEAVPGGLRPALAAARARLGLVAVLLVLAGGAWWWSVERMRGMDQGPWSTLGGSGWFLGLWVVMMAAMMFPSVWPTVALYARMTKARSPLAPTAFVSGYLVTWAAAGVAALVLSAAATRAAGDVLAWDRAGQPLAGATLVGAAVYELTPLKDVCLGKCRSPLGALLGSWRDGLRGALRMGMANGAWCVGCCWALMASLFALGVMNVIWMAVVAGLIAAEKTLPPRRAVTLVTAAVLLSLGLLLLASPGDVPGLTLPGRTPMPVDMGAAS